MASTKHTGDRATKRIRWIARIWGTVIIAFTLLMLIGYAWNWVTTGKADPHAVEDYPPIENLIPITLGLSVFARYGATDSRPRWATDRRQSRGQSGSYIL